MSSPLFCKLLLLCYWKTICGNAVEYPAQLKLLSHSGTVSRIAAAASLASAVQKLIVLWGESPACSLSSQSLFSLSFIKIFCNLFKPSVFPVKI